LIPDEKRKDKEKHIYIMYEILKNTDKPLLVIVPMDIRPGKGTDRGIFNT